MYRFPVSIELFTLVLAAARGQVIVQVIGLYVRVSIADVVVGLLQPYVWTPLWKRLQRFVAAGLLDVARLG